MNKDFKNFLKEKRWTQAEFGKMVGVDQKTVSFWMNGILKPSLHNAFKVQKITRGKVKAKSFLEGLDDV